MKDRKLEEQISGLERFVGGWKKLREMASSGEGEEKVPEEELLKLKEELASLHGSLMTGLGIDEKRCMEFLEGLGRDPRGAELRRFLDSWHSCLMFMDEIRGRLTERRSQLADISRARVVMRAFFSNPFVRLAALFLCILLLHFIIKTFVIREDTARERSSIKIERRL